MVKQSGVPSSDAHLDAQVVAVAPGVFLQLGRSSGAAAVIFDHIARNRLYTRTGAKSMRTFATEHLGIKSDAAYKKIAAAGKSAWSYCAQISTGVLKAVCNGTNLTATGFPELPSETTLVALRRAEKRLGASEHAILVARVVAGTCTAKEIDLAGRTQRQGGTPRPETLPADVSRALQMMAQAEARLRRQNPGTIEDDVVGLLGQQLAALQGAILLHQWQVGTKAQPSKPNSPRAEVLQAQPAPAAAPPFAHQMVPLPANPFIPPTGRSCAASPATRHQMVPLPANPFIPPQVPSLPGSSKDAVPEGQRIINAWRRG